MKYGYKEKKKIFLMNLRYFCISLCVLCNFLIQKYCMMRVNHFFIQYMDYICKNNLKI